MVGQNDITRYWEKEVCGTRFVKRDKKDIAYYENLRDSRYWAEPSLRSFAFGQNPKSLKNKKLLEIGVGAGTDFIEFLKNGAICYGIDATEAAINESRNNIQLAFSETKKEFNLKYLKKINAEKLPFPDNEFDIVYSFGVLHHAKNTMRCLSEAIRVLKPGGTLKIMVYSDFSAVGLMLWILHGLLKFKIFKSQEEIIFKHLESPGTKCYSQKELKKILEGFSMENIVMKKYVGTGDLFLMPPSAKYKNSILFKIVKKIYPRFIIRRFPNLFAMGLTVNAKKV